MELLNAYPSVYSSDVIEPGLVSYEDSKDGVWKLTKPTLDKMRSSAIGIPVVIGHQKVTKENYEELKKKGIIVGNVIGARVGQNGWDNWDILIDQQDGRDKIDKEKYTVSCAYAVINKGEGGLCHDIKYDGEILDAAYTHLALVDSPRYEDAKIEKRPPALMMNGKAAHITPTTEDKEMLDGMIKFFQAVNGKKVEVDPTMEINGQEFKLKDVMKSFIALNEKIEKGKLIESPTDMKGVSAKAGDLVDINGHSYKVNEKGELINIKYLAANAKNCNCDAKDGDGHKENCPMFEKKNAAETPEEKAKREKEEKEKLDKKNATDAEAKAKAEEDEKKNAKKKKGEDLFNALNTLANFTQDQPSPAPKFMTREERANKKKLEVDGHFKK